MNHAFSAPHPVPPRRSTFGRAAWLVAVAASGLGCGENGGEGPVTASAAVANVDSLPRLELVEELRIGSVEDPDYGFSRIGSVHVDEVGRIYVFEALDRQIRVYGPDGTLLRAMGGPGEGPGEFQGRQVRFGVVRDTVWAADWSPLGFVRLSRFDASGAPVGTDRVEEVGVGRDATGVLEVLVAPTATDGEGRLVGDLNPFAVIGLAGDPDSVRVPRVRFDREGRVVDTAGWYTRPMRSREARFVDVGSSRYILPRPTLDEPLDISLPDGHVRIDRPTPTDPAGAEFRVTRVAFGGDTVYSRRLRYTPVPYPDEWLDEIAGVAARPRSVTVYGPSEVTPLVAHPQDSARAQAVIRDEMPFPAFQLPVTGGRSFMPHHVGSDGSLWLRREDTREETLRWTVLGPDGAAVGEAHLPREDFHIGFSDGERLWVTERDELGVPWLVRYRVVGR